MCRAISMMLLAVMSSSAMAEWKKIEGVRGSDSNYFDPVSANRNGTRAQIQTLVNFVEKQRTETDWYVSAKYRTEYDCNKKQWRLLESRLYKEPMGGGEAIVINTRSSAGWMPTLPGTLTELNMGIACVEH